MSKEWISEHMCSNLIRSKIDIFFASDKPKDAEPVKIIYTDGASRPASEGSASKWNGASSLFVDFGDPDNLVERAPEPGTNQVAELYAILLALKYAIAL